MSNVELTLNGRALTVDSGTTIAGIVALVLGDHDSKGIAVAVDRDVVPRSQWHTTGVVANSCVEIVTAAAGG